MIKNSKLGWIRDNKFRKYQKEGKAANRRLRMKKARSCWKKKKYHPRLTPNRIQIQMKKKDEEEDPIRNTLKVINC